MRLSRVSAVRRRSARGAFTLAPLTLALAAGAVLPMTFGLSTASAQESTRNAERAASADPVYRPAPEAIARILNSAPLPAVSLSPKRDRMILVDRVTLPPVADLAKPMLKLAGNRIDPDANAPHAPRRLTGMTIRSLDGSVSAKLQLTGLNDAEPDLSMPSWSHDNRHFMFTVKRETGVELWVGDADTGLARALTDPMLNTAAGGAAQWMPDGKTILAKLVPEARGAAPQRPSAPTGPVIQETLGKTAQVRTYQDMLRDAHDEAMYEFVMTSRLVLIDAATGGATPIGAPAMYGSVDPSPDGRFVLVSRTMRPFSYLVPDDLFPQVVEVWNRDGTVAATLANVPLREEIPIEGVQTGPRGHEWADTLPSTLLWAEALDGGNPETKAEHRDKVMRLDAPFTGTPVEVLRTQHRYSGMFFVEPHGALTTPVMFSEYDRDRRWTRTWMTDLGAADVGPRLVFDRSIRDRYNNPGTPLMKRTESGRMVARVHQGAVYLTGAGASPDGDLPFLDRMPLDTFKPERLWRSEKGSFETVVDVLADDASSFMVSYETPTEPPNYFTRAIAPAEDGSRVVSGRTRLTDFPHPAPELKDIRKELVRYTRADGVELSATMYLPPGFDPAAVRRGEARPLPLVLWAYPLEFNDAATAGQVSGSTSRFTIFGGISHLFLLTQGYAVMDDATMPIVGDPLTMNDTFVDQIVAAARAAIDKAVEMGVADRDRVAVGGHSYGAFMTANLMAHCDLFRAGIARSGAYNRTLTPFGFQGERRTYWQAPEVYARLSPFTFADKINEPLLLIHGQIDSNPGTFPVQSERLYAAIKGTGGTARLVMLPYEDHGYAARESVFHVHAEMTEWLDRWVKNAPPREAIPGSEAPPSAGASAAPAR